jgi:hypothetical protein
MTDLTNFQDTSDVSDAAIDWVLRATESAYTAEQIRRGTKQNNPPDRARLIAARLIQAHRPDLLVDPVDVAVDAFMQEAGFIDPTTREAAKRIYLMGLEAGKAQG